MSSITATPCARWTSATRASDTVTFIQIVSPSRRRNRFSVVKWGICPVNNRCMLSVRSSRSSTCTTSPIFMVRSVSRPSPSSRPSESFTSANEPDASTSAIPTAALSKSAFNRVSLSRSALATESSSRRCSRALYWRWRARSAVCTAVMRAAMRTGRSRSVTLPSERTAWRTDAESAP
jgi:hypothetical protein